MREPNKYIYHFLNLSLIFTALDGRHRSPRVSKGGLVEQAVSPLLTRGLLSSLTILQFAVALAKRKPIKLPAFSTLSIN